MTGDLNWYLAKVTKNMTTNFSNNQRDPPMSVKPFRGRGEIPYCYRLITVNKRSGWVVDLKIATPHRKHDSISISMLICDDGNSGRQRLAPEAVVRRGRRLIGGKGEISSGWLCSLVQHGLRTSSSCLANWLGASCGTA
jgi:hypothetical protein